jgi:hypothetical protein
MNHQLLDSPHNSNNDLAFPGNSDSGVSSVQPAIPRKLLICTVPKS